MKNFHIEIDIDNKGDMIISEDGSTGETYYIDESEGLNSMIEQITGCLGNYLNYEYDDRTIQKKQEHIKTNNMMSTDGELKQWQKDVMAKDYLVAKLQKNSLYGKTVDKDITERSCIMSREEMKEFLKPKNDPVNYPSHYTDGKIEVIDFIEDKKLGFHLGNAVKYIARAGKKDPAKTVEDLEKAIWYIKRYIEDYKEKDGLNIRNGYFAAVDSFGDTDGDTTINTMNGGKDNG
jgi:hypothetical protein